MHNLVQPTLMATLLRPWIERYTMIISACGFEQATNLVARNRRNLRDIGIPETLKQVQIRPNTK